MKQKHLARLAAFSVGVTGGAAFGDDHLGDEITEAECDLLFPFDCNDVCKELADCLLDGDILDCWDELDGLTTCAFPPPSPPAPPPLLVCPAGQHFAEGGGCHADHECGDDEIGGGDADCEACPDGEIPNEDGTACVTCEHGEHSLNPGTCACDQESVDDLAIDQLKKVPKDAWEHYERYYCAGGLNPSVGSRTYSTEGQKDVCSIDARSEVMSWAISSIAVGHSHPYFDPGRDYSGDNAVQCGSTIINSARKAGIFNHVIGRQFSDADMQWSKPTYLVVPLRDEVKVYRPDTNSEESIWTR